MNIKEKLILTFLALSLIPIIVISSIFFNQAESSLKHDRIAALESIATLKVAVIESFMDDLRKDVTIAQDYFNIKTNLPQIIRFAQDRDNPVYIQAKKNLDGQFNTLQRILKFADIMLLSPDGIVVYVTNESHADVDVGKPLVHKKAFEEGKKRIYFSDMIKVKDAFVGDEEAIGVAFEMLVTAPLFGLNGDFIGVLALEVDMQPVHALIEQTTGLGVSGETLIAQNMGDYVLFLNALRHDPQAAMHRRVKFGSEHALPIQEAVQGYSGSGVSVDYRGVEVIADWRYLPDLKWGMVSKIDVSEAFQSIRVLKNLVLLIVVVVLLVIVFLAIVIARSFSKPIQSLKDGITRIGQGDLDYRVGTDRKDEIGQLSRAFDVMTVNLKSATASRQDFENEIAERKQAEDAMAAKNSEIAIRNRYEASYGMIVSLYSKSIDQQEMLIGTLDVLAKKHPFPVAAIYLYDEWSGQLKRAADHGVPSTLPQSFKLGEGVIGQVIKDGQTVILDEMDGAGILSIDTGLLSFSAAAVIAVPVHFQGRPLAVLVLACSKPLLDLDKHFIERLAGQLGVALNNVIQHQALTDLAAQLKTHSKEIKEKNSQLEQANRMKSEFLANMSHELRTPLNAIIGFSELLKDGMIGELQSEQKEFVGDIFTSGKHLLSLINDVLDLSKVEAGKMELNLEPVNVSDVLYNCVSIIKERAMEHCIKLDCDFGEEMDSCFMDGRKVKQIIYNLLSNAVKFTPNGGTVTLGVRRVMADKLNMQAQGRPVPMSPPGKKTAEYMEITVSDTGIGISDADQQRLFTPFQQLESPMTKVYEGTGLGLVILKRLAELHGGAVGMDSTPGQGSTFVIWLPYLVSEQQVGSVHKALDVERLDDRQSGMNIAAYQHTVLMVEDDEKVAALMRVQLEAAGYMVSHAISAEQALDMLANELPDLITLDILLPGMDGWDFMQELKRRPDAVGIPIVVVSIMANSDKGFSLGAADVLQKPVERQQLLDAVAALDFSLDGKHVLVVDDDPKAVELVSKHLLTVGCDVLKAYGGKEAIEIAKAELPDLIILDLMMPKVSGFDVVEKLRYIPDLARIPIIILTARVLNEADRRQLNGDIVKIMQKSSFNHGNFIREVNRAVHRDKQRSS